MKILEAEVMECTEPTVNEACILWNPITVKIKQTDEYAGVIGKQLLKQNNAFKKDKLDYKFKMNLDEWLLEGCWLTDIIYGDASNSYMEITVRFDNATLYDEEK